MKTAATLLFCLLSTLTTSIPTKSGLYCDHNNSNKKHLITKQQVVEKLNLSPHFEGGYFLETYKSNDFIPDSVLNERYPNHDDENAKHSMATAIYFLLGQEDKSTLHQLTSDEVWHFYLGCPVKLIMIDTTSTQEWTVKHVVLGHDILLGHSVQYVVPAGVWFGAELLPSKETKCQYDFALTGTTVAPGFEVSDFKFFKDNFTQEFVESASNINAEIKETILSLTSWE